MEKGSYWFSTESGVVSFFWHKCQNLMQCTLKILLAVTSVVIMITICSIFCSDYNTSTTSLTCLISLFHVNL